MQLDEFCGMKQMQLTRRQCVINGAATLAAAAASSALPGLLQAQTSVPARKLRIGIAGERLIEVSCDGWGNDDAIPKQNPFSNNPFWNETAHFRSDKGTPLRLRVWWEGPVWDTVSASWFGNKMTVTAAGERWTSTEQTGRDDAGFVVGKANKSRLGDPPWWKTDLLPESLRHASGHEGSHTFITHEFVDAINGGRRPAIDIREALAYTVPGIIAHQSALKGGERLRIPTIA
jgi:hypothetical protein